MTPPLECRIPRAKGKLNFEGGEGDDEGRAEKAAKASKAQELGQDSSITPSPALHAIAMVK